MAKLLGLVIFVFIATNQNQVSAINNERRLVNELLANYEKHGGRFSRPVENENSTLKLEFGIRVITIHEVNEKEQRISTNVWAVHRWKDVLLQWNPDQYGGLKEIRLPIDKIWKPDIDLFNVADERLEVHHTGGTVVNNSGVVMWIPRAIYKSSCTFDITNFPFDDQLCVMKFASWTYHGSQLKLVKIDDRMLHDYMPTLGWDIMNAAVREIFGVDPHFGFLLLRWVEFRTPLADFVFRRVVYYPSHPEAWPDIMVYLHIRRYNTIQNYTLVWSGVLFSLLTLVMFSLPSGSSDKLHLGMVLFLAFFTLLLILSSVLPPWKRTAPRLVKFHFVNMVIIAVSLTLSVLIEKLRDRKEKVPRCLKRVSGAMSLSLCTRCCAAKRNEERLDRQPLVEQHNPADDVEKESTSFSNQATTPNEQTIHDIDRSLKELLSRLKDKAMACAIASEWQAVVMVLDRILFLVYLIVIIILMATTLPWETPLSAELPFGDVFKEQ